MDRGAQRARRLSRKVEKMDLQISADIKDGDYGRKFAQVEIGGITITVYQSNIDQDGVVIEIDTAPDNTSELAVHVNDAKIT